MENFTFEEINFIYCFKEDNKINTIANINNNILYVEETMQELAKQCIDKLNKLDEKEFIKVSSNFTDYIEF